MSLVESYGIWNNKGGVGKSTITFHVAARYAALNKDKNVLVIDLCPQSNSSMMLLGGGARGEQAVLDYGTEGVPRTVVGYLSKVISGGSGAPIPDPMDFLVQVSDTNDNMTDNLYLLCGDGNLEPMAPAIANAANQPPLTPDSHPWVWVHQIFRNLIDNVTETVSDKDWMVFVDTNPSFSTYTQLAICSVNKLICPVNADDSSRVATNAMFILLHGNTPPHPVYGSWTFASQAKNHDISIPEIHLIVGNRLTQYQGAAAAFAAMSDSTTEALFDAYQNHPGYFTSRSPSPTTKEDFRDRYSVPLRDFNSAGVVSAHLGQRLSQMSGTYYEINGEDVKLERARIDECTEAIDDVISEL